MEYVHLGDLIVAAKTNRCGDDDFPVLSITKSDGIVFQSEKFKKRIASKDTADYKVVRRGQLVQGIHIDEANFGIQEIVDIGIVSPAYKIWDIKSNAIVPKYLEIILRSPRSIAYYASRFNGSIKRRERLSDKDFLQMKIPCPPLEEQIYAIELLSKATTLIEQRKQQITELDNLIKARFVEMFGDPKYNKSNLVKIGEIGALTSGGTPPRVKPEYFEGDIRWYSAGELNSLYLPDSIEHISETALQESSAKLFTKGTLMIGMYDTAAFKMGILAENASSNQACANLNPKQGYNIVWLYYLFDIMKPIFLQERQGVRQKNLSLSKIKEFEVPVAPFELQEQFAAFVEQVDKSKVVVQKALDEAQTLFDSLMQEYFG